MILPIYYNFDDFFHNYEDNLQEWKEFFPDGTENDFKSDYRKRYSTFYRYDKNYTPTEEVSEEVTLMVRAITEDSPSLFENCDLEYLSVLVQDRIDILLKKGQEIKSMEDIIVKTLDLVSYIQRFDDNYVLDQRDFEKYRTFFSFQNNSLHFDKNKFKNFTFSLKRISKFLAENENENSGQATANSDPATVDSVMPNPKIERSKIISKGNIQIIGLVFSKLLEGNHIEYVLHKTTGRINKKATARMIYENFSFIKQEKDGLSYFTKTIFDNVLSNDKTDLIKIPPLQKFQ